MISSHGSGGSRQADTHRAVWTTGRKFCPLEYFPIAWVSSHQLCSFHLQLTHKCPNTHEGRPFFILKDFHNILRLPDLQVTFHQLIHTQLHPDTSRGEVP